MISAERAMRSRPPERRWAERWPRRYLHVAAAGLLGGVGLLLVGQGAYIKAKAVVAQVLLEQAFAQTIETGRAIKPWSWADTWPVARVSISRLEQSAIVLEGGSGQALAFGPGRLAGSAVAGRAGTTVYAAHRDTHFAFLADVRIGDEIVVTRADGQDVTFRVSATSIVKWDRTGIDLQARGSHLVLATCWPFGARTMGPDRYLVHAEVSGGQGG